MPLCHRDHTPESISLQQRSVAKVQLSLLDCLPSRERGPGCWAGPAPCHPRAAQGCGSSRHLWPHAGDSWLPGPAYASPSEQPPPPPTALWLNILLVYRNSALLTPPRPAAAAGELLEFPAQPDSAQSSCTFLPPLRCGVWNASGRKLGILPSGPVVIPHTLSPVQNLFLIFTPPWARHAHCWSPDACSASRSASRLCVGVGWYGVEVGVLGCFPSIYGRQMESLRHSSIIPPGKGWEHLESSRRALTHPAASLTSYSWLSFPSDKKRAASVGSGRW